VIRYLSGWGAGACHQEQERLSDGPTASVSERDSHTYHACSPEVLVVRAGTWLTAWQGSLNVLCLRCRLAATSKRRLFLTGGPQCVCSFINLRYVST